jgi:hypothetical protein
MMAQIIQKELTLHTRINETCLTSGIDSFYHCADKLHYLKYPYKVEYKFNSRGFRDDEWPNSEKELSNAIWCVGDSFTVGLGSPIDHTWPKLLAQATGKITINVSMEGASNEWIARQIDCIEKKYSPKNIVVMWSYWNRREKNDPFLLDEDRRIHMNHSLSHYADDLKNFFKCQNKAESTVGNNLVQLAIPYSPYLFNDLNWGELRGTDWPLDIPDNAKEFSALPKFILEELKNLGAFEQFETFYSSLDNLSIKEIKNLYAEVSMVPQLDYARDHHHFDKRTSQWVVDTVVGRLI